MRFLDRIFGRRDRDDSTANRDGSEANRDGSSEELAVIVNSIPEEYAWMKRHCPEYQLDPQSLQKIDGKHYDVMKLSSARGEERTVYFDISKFFGAR